MTGVDHFCPVCAAPQKSFGRYPWHICNACVGKAQDGAGHPLEFGNASMSGGLVWRRQGEEDWQDTGAIRCLIAGRPVLVREARFGGVVAEPIPSGPLGHEPYKLVDLTHP
jgi:hypothetical protein